MIYYVNNLMPRGKYIEMLLLLLILILLQLHFSNDTILDIKTTWFIKEHSHFQYYFSNLIEKHILIKAELYHKLTFLFNFVDPVNFSVQQCVHTYILTWEVGSPKEISLITTLQ